MRSSARFHSWDLRSVRTALVLYLPHHVSCRDDADRWVANRKFTPLRRIPPARAKPCLDEVADRKLRRTVVRWMERQVEFGGANRFLISSRPNGYRDNPLTGFTALEVLPFKPAQVEQFARNWYLANEVVAHQKCDAGVRMEADNGANELLDRLRHSPGLFDLAVNPLLLTLIATVHRYHSQLPSRRVELFAEVCEVFLGRRRQAKGMELDLAPAQKVRVLRVLAYELMCREIREIKVEESAVIIASVLKLVASDTEASNFLSMVEDSWLGPLPGSFAHYACRVSIVHR